MATSKKVATTTGNGKPKLARSAIGAPSQLNQSSRKGKKAWRKNVDIGDVEQTLEEMRAEERVTGTTIGKMQDTELFQIDTKGDDKIRHSLPRYSAAKLTSTKILSQRSAVPAVFSRVTPSSGASQKRKAVMSREDKERLMRIAKRPRKGPFNSVLDPSEYAAGSGIVELSEAVKQSGTYDPWAEEEEEEVKDGMETVIMKKVKPPAMQRTRDLIEIPAIVQPHQGTSYNPPVDAHQELLEKAASIEEKRLKDADKLAEVKSKMTDARLEQEEYDFAVAAGMTVQEQQEGKVEEDAGDRPEEENLQSSVRKVPERKTKAQRNKTARALAEKRALADKAARKRLLASISDAKTLRRMTAQVMSTQEKERELRRLALAEKLKKQGLAGRKLGKHKVPEGRVDVQLGEDLSESLRGLKPEGSLFHDRFQSLQQRALVEPRVPVLPKKRRNRMIEYEKHAWKRFE